MSATWSPFAKMQAPLLVALALGAALMVGPARVWWVGAIAAISAAVLVLGVVSPRLQIFCPAIARATTDERVAALTFDDGPDPRTTPLLLDLLRDLDVRATFFCVGRRAEAAPDLVRRIQAAGHLIGNHTYGHAWWTNFLSSAGLRREIDRTQAALEAITGARPAYFRPPMGLTSPHLRSAVEGARVRVVAWDRGGGDQRARDPVRVVDRVVRGTRTGSIVLLHDADIAALRLLAIVRGAVDGLRARGFRLVRLDALLGEAPLSQDTEATEHTEATE